MNEAPAQLRGAPWSTWAQTLEARTVPQGQHLPRTACGSGPKISPGGHPRKWDRAKPEIGSPRRKHDPTQRSSLKGAVSPTGDIFPRDGREKVDFRVCNVELSRELPATSPAAILPSELLPPGRGAFGGHSHSLWRMGGPQRIPRVAHFRHRSNDENSQGRI